MKREIIMISLIIALVIIGHVITQKFTQDFFEEIEEDFVDLKEQILIARQTESNNNNLIEKIKVIQEKWDNKYNALAYYTEHDELEKVGAQIVLIDGYLETKDYINSTAEIDRTIFLLQYIRDKDNFKLVNIF